MPSKFTPSLRLEQQANGENDTTWGDIANNNFEFIEAAISGKSTITMSDADYTLTTRYGASDDARSMILAVQGSLNAARNVIIPAQTKMYVVRNTTSGGFGITIKTTGGAGVLIANGETRMVICDGNNTYAAGAGNDVKVGPSGLSTDSATWSVKGFFGVNRSNGVDPAYGVLGLDGTSGSYAALYANGALVGTVTATAAGLVINAPSTPIVLATGGVVRQTIGTNGVSTFSNDVVSNTNMRGQQGIFESDVFGRSMTITNAAPALYMVDTDGPDRSLVTNGGLIGFGLSNGNWGVYNDDSGNVVATGNVTAYSDERKKTDWLDLDPDFLTGIAGLKSGTYTDIATGIRRTGIGAQSLQAVLPEAVMETQDGTLAVSYGNAAMVGVVELAREVLALRARLDKLENA